MSLASNLSFYTNYLMVMAVPHVLVLDDSFIRHLHYILGKDFTVSHILAGTVIHWHSISSRMVAAILQLHSNDLTAHDPLHVGLAIESFIRLLHDMELDLLVFLKLCLEKGIHTIIKMSAF